MSLYFLPSSLHRPLLSNSSTNRRRHGVGHIRIQNAGDYYDLYGAKRFSTLDELVDYYRQHRRVLSKATGVTDVELRNPLSCEEPRWAWHCKAWYTMAGDFCRYRAFASRKPFEPRDFHYPRERTKFKSSAVSNYLAVPTPGNACHIECVFDGSENPSAIQ